MDDPALLRHIEELEKENRALKHKLESSERMRAELEETLETHTNALKVRNTELEESKEKLKLSEARYREMALHDTLTELPNRTFFNLKLERVLSRAKTAHLNTALLFMDLDLFKSVNDGLGHRAGDAVLVQVAERLLSCVRNDDFVARLGGDEFAIILPEIEAMSDAEKVARRIISAFSAPFRVDERSGHIGVSIGISVYPDDMDDSEKLLQFADAAMYRAKKSGGNAYQLFHDLHGSH